MAGVTDNSNEQTGFVVLANAIRDHGQNNGHLETLCWLPRPMEKKAETQALAEAVKAAKKLKKLDLTSSGAPHIETSHRYRIHNSNQLATFPDFQI